VRAPWLFVSVSHRGFNEDIKNSGRVERESIVIFIEPTTFGQMMGQIIIVPGAGCVVIPSVAASELGKII